LTNVCLSSASGTNNTGNNGIFIGAGTKNGSGNENIAIGNSAGSNAMTGVQNICIGSGSGSNNLTNNNDCIYIGRGFNNIGNAGANNMISIGLGVTRRANEAVIGSSATTHIRPNADNHCDLGYFDGVNNAQYKNIYISGGIYVNNVLQSFGGGGVGAQAVLLKEVSAPVASSAITIHTRNLNAIVNPNNYSWCILGGPSFTLSVGVYAIRGRCTGYQVGHTQAFIYNVTDAVYENLDQPLGYTVDPQVIISIDCQTIINVVGSAKQFELRQWTQNGNAIGLSGQKSGDFTNNPSGISSSSNAEVSIIKLG